MLAYAFSRCSFMLNASTSRLDPREGDEDLPPPSDDEPAADENDEAVGERAERCSDEDGVLGRTGVEISDAAAGVDVFRDATASLILSIAWGSEGDARVSQR